MLPFYWMVFLYVFCEHTEKQISFSAEQKNGWCIYGDANGLKAFIETRKWPIKSQTFLRKIRQTKYMMYQINHKLHTQIERHFRLWPTEATVAVRRKK